jgi:hypothetical protein
VYDLAGFILADNLLHSIAMGRRARDTETMNMFGEQPLQPGEKGYLDPAYHREGKKIIHTGTGNEVDEEYNVIREAKRGQEAEELAAKMHPELVGKPDFPTMVADAQRMLDERKKKK